MKNFSLCLAALLIWNSAVFAGATLAAPKKLQTQSQKEQQTAKIESAVRKRGTGERSRVKVMRTNGSQVKGYISKLDESSFAVTDKKTGQTTTIAYGEVQKIQGPGLSTGEKVAIGVGVGVAVFVIVGVIIARSISH